jgi:hypothetical protein
MKTAPAPASKASSIEHKKSLLETFPIVVTFVGYLLAHDAHHRGQISMLARQVGHPVPPKVGFGLWEWGALWRDCGCSR